MTLDLAALSKQSSFALELGKAAEHLVCADLLLKGYRAFLSDQGLPYDLLVDIDNHLIRIQVKSTCFAKNVNAKGRNPRIAYNFSIRRRGKNGKGSLTEKDCDIVALVALDTRTIAYFPVEHVGQSIQLRPKDSEPASIQGWLKDISEFPFEAALLPDASFYADGKSKRKTCIKGHDRSMFSSINKNGIEYCKICSRDYQRKYRLSLGDLRQ